MSEIYFRQIKIGPMANYAYLVGDTETHEAAVVDPAWDADDILSIALSDGFTLRHVLATHGHPDHINAAQEVLRKTGGRLYLHEAEIEWLGAKGEDIESTRHGDSIRIGGVEVKVLHTPGHTPGSQCFLVGDRLITGDTLFVDACGRTDLPGGDARALFRSLNEVIAGLDDSTEVFPGHAYSGASSSTIGEQKRTNPFLRMSSAEEFLDVMN